MSDSGLGVDEGLVREAQGVDELRRLQVTVVTEESCTGGLIAALLSHAVGASDCLHGRCYTRAQVDGARCIPRVTAVPW
jgi:nicotinamide mononucleotide (NMN) deamidase PncC